MSKLDSYSKKEIEELLKKHTLSHLAKLLGYSHKIKSRGAGLREALKRKGWWEEFRERGII